MRLLRLNRVLLCVLACELFAAAPGAYAAAITFDIGTFAVTEDANIEQFIFEVQNITGPNADGGQYVVPALTFAGTFDLSGFDENGQEFSIPPEEFELSPEDGLWSFAISSAQQITEALVSVDFQPVLFQLGDSWWQTE